MVIKKSRDLLENKSDQVHNNEGSNKCLKASRTRVTIDVAEIAKNDHTCSGNK